VKDPISSSHATILGLGIRPRLLRTKGRKSRPNRVTKMTNRSRKRLAKVKNTPMGTLSENSQMSRVGGGPIRELGRGGKESAGEREGGEDEN